LVELAEDEPIWLFPGDFDVNEEIAQADYANIKARVGLTESETQELVEADGSNTFNYNDTYYNTKYDINEYTGIDGGDLASVKSGVGKEVGDNKYNAKTITVNEAD
jgi:hypothetical protein